eukprot:3039354-Lingulodinium_polyedra.AAC.1
MKRWGNMSKGNLVGHLKAALLRACKARKRCRSILGEQAEQLVEYCKALQCRGRHVSLLFDMPKSSRTCGVRLVVRSAARSGGKPVAKRQRSISFHQMREIAYTSSRPPSDIGFCYGLTAKWVK